MPLFRFLQLVVVYQLNQSIGISNFAYELIILLLIALEASLRVMPILIAVGGWAGSCFFLFCNG